MHTLLPPPVSQSGCRMRTELFSLCTWLGSLASKFNPAHHSTQQTHVSGRKVENKPQQTGVQTPEMVVEGGGAQRARMRGAGGKKIHLDSVVDPLIREQSVNITRN